MNKKIDINKLTQFEPPKILEVIPEKDLVEDGKTKPNFPLHLDIGGEKWSVASVEKGTANLESPCKTRQKKESVIGLKWSCSFFDLKPFADFLTRMKKDGNYPIFE
jgi:hypothetical protein